MTLRTRNSKKPLRMLARKCEAPMAPAMPCKISEKSKLGKPVARLMISSLTYQMIIRTISQEKETIHHSIAIWYTNLFLCLKP